MKIVCEPCAICHPYLVSSPIYTLLHSSFFKFIGFYLLVDNSTPSRFFNSSSTTPFERGRRIYTHAWSSSYPAGGVYIRFRTYSRTPRPIAHPWWRSLVALGKASLHSLPNPLRTRPHLGRAKLLRLRKSKRLLIYAAASLFTTLCTSYRVARLWHRAPPNG